MAVIAAITGFSTSGKTYVSQLLDPFTFRPLVSHTTRQPRPGEFEGLDYYYTSKDEFEALEAAGGFIESIEFCGYRYGLSGKEIEKALEENKALIHVCTPQGVVALQEYAENNGHSFVSAFIEADEVTIINRMLKRITSANGAGRDYITQRIATALVEENEWGGDYHCILKDSNEVATVAQLINDYSKGGAELPISKSREGQLFSYPGYKVEVMQSAVESLIPDRIPKNGRECWALAESIAQELKLNHVKFKDWL